MRTARRAGVRQRGFTLIELMIVIVVAGILVGFTVPSWVSMQRSLLKEQARERIVQDIRTARQTAVTGRVPVVVAFLPSGGGPIVEYTIHVDTNDDRLVDAGEPWRRVRLPKGTGLTQVAIVPSDSLRFVSSGSLAPGNTGGTIVVSNGRGKADTLMVSSVGMLFRP
jgi:prepilin-type N-terminal cleavage/methylation domain-containing protein